MKTQRLKATKPSSYGQKPPSRSVKCPPFYRQNVSSYVLRNLLLQLLLKHAETDRNRLDEALAKLPARRRLQA